MRTTRRSVGNKNTKKQIDEVTHSSTEEPNEENYSVSDNNYRQSPITKGSNGYALTNFNESNEKDEHTVTIYSQSFNLTKEEIRKCQEAAERYIRNCHRFHLPVDSSVVIALRSGWDILHPTNRFTEGSLLPLMDILCDYRFIKKVNLTNVSMQDSRFRNIGNGSSNARVINHILQHNKWIRELNLSNNGLDDDGIQQICEGIANNTSITALNLSSNYFGEAGAQYLATALERNTSIKQLDLSRNALGFSSISNLRCVCTPKNIDLDSNGNYVFEEILNSVSHGIAFLGSVIGANILIADAADVYRTDYHFWACVLYSFALMFLFLSSCLFHSFFMIPTTSRILQILDHIGIYLVIAGTYTPFLLIGLHQHSSARVLLCAEWVCALLGGIFATCSDLNNPMTTLVELSFFLIMGFGVLLVWPLMTELSHEALFLLFLGGALYVIGIIFFILGEYKPIYHTIWHLFVVAAACVHWFDVYFFIVQISLEDNATKTAMRGMIDVVDNVLDAANNITMAGIMQQMQ